MRNGQNNKRMRGRNRKSHNPLGRVYESNGPDVKVRGTPSHIAEKYMQLARDAQSSGDPIAAESYFQHAEHYFRLIASAQEQFRQNNPYYQQGNPQGAADTREDYEDGEEDNPAAGASDQPVFGTRDPQPFIPRDAQYFSQRDSAGQARHGFAPQDDDSAVDKLPSFITGSQSAAAPPHFQPPTNGQNGQHGQDSSVQGERDRFNRRRRRHRGPRPDIGGSGHQNVGADGGDEPLQ